MSVLKADLSMTLDELACKHAGLLQDLLDKTARVSKTSLFEALLLQMKAMTHKTPSILLEELLRQCQQAGKCQSQ